MQLLSARSMGHHRMQSPAVSLAQVERLNMHDPQWSPRNTTLGAARTSSYVSPLRTRSSSRLGRAISQGQWDSQVSEASAHASPSPAALQRLEVQDQAIRHEVARDRIGVDPENPYMSSYSYSPAVQVRKQSVTCRMHSGVLPSRARGSRAYPRALYGVCYPQVKIDEKRARMDIARGKLEHERRLEERAQRVSLLGPASPMFSSAPSASIEAGLQPGIQ
jgi:hypothetical protein